MVHRILFISALFYGALHGMENNEARPSQSPRSESRRKLHEERVAKQAHEERVAVQALFTYQSPCGANRNMRDSCGEQQKPQTSTSADSPDKYV